MFMGTSTGMVRATMRAPAARARVEASSCRVTRSGARLSTVRTFQFRGRRAAADMATSRSISSSLKVFRQPSTMPSSVVPSCSPTAAHRASSSSFPAQRDATGWPSPSEWEEDMVVDRPRPPLAMLSCSTRTMAASCSSVGFSPTASGPMT